MNYVKLQLQNANLHTERRVKWYYFNYFLRNEYRIQGSNRFGVTDFGPPIRCE